MRKIILTISLALLLLIAGPAAAQDDETHFSTSVTYEFGSQLDFEVTVFTTVGVSRAAVIFGPASSPDTQVVYADLTETGVGAYHASAAINLRLASLPAFIVVEYQWLLELTDGGSIRSQTYEFRYFDNRLDWQTISGNNVSVHWVEGDLAFGQAALDMAVEARFEIAFEMGLNHVSPTEVFIYPSLWQLQSALGLGSPGWVAGHSDPANRSILIFAPDDPQARLTFETDIPHEMTHLLLYERLGEQGYRALPGWLNEGLAAIHQGNPDPAAPSRLQEASQDDQLLDFNSLCGAFPFGEDQAALAYLQSQSFVQWLLDQYGEEALMNLVDAYADGSACGAGLERVYDRSLDEISRMWQQDVLGVSAVGLQMRRISPWFLVSLTPVIILAVAMVDERRRRRHSS